MNDRELIIALKPRYAEAILAGTKTVELRRVRPLIKVPTCALLYSSSPTMAFVGTCRIESIVSLTPREMWRNYADQTGINKQVFDTYFEGCETAHGLLVSTPSVFEAPVTLNEVRRWWPGFQPPQSFRYLPENVGVAKRLRKMLAA